MNFPLFASPPILRVAIICMSDLVIVKSVNARKRSYPPVQAGEKIVIPWETKDYKMACCDCGLVHRLRFTVEGSDLILQGWRDNRATAQLRRRREYDGKSHILNSPANDPVLATAAGNQSNQTERNDT